MRTWVEVDTAALTENVRAFRHLVGSTLLAPTVKSNGYGHGLLLAARAFLAGGADWLCVDALDEARTLRAAGIAAPIYVFGYVPLDELAEAASLDLRLVVYNRETIDRLAALGAQVRVHLKVETGNHRQGLPPAEVLALADHLRRSPGIVLEGLSSHFANIEDTTDHTYARHQLACFEAAVAALQAAGHAVPMRHLSNTAATLLWPDQRFEMVRLGIGAYGIWPSKETRIAALLTGRAEMPLRPALTWKTRVAQVKSVPEGAFVGYGCTYMTTHPTRLAILPVGYADGFDRGLSNLAHVLIRGRRAPVRGRICMNITMVDVTDIPDAALEDEVVLLGGQGSERLTADQIGDWAQTISYEVLARIGGHLPRVEVPGSAAPHPGAAARAWRPPRAD
ncbi:alanine racemase [Myxococcota bacterium]|jgi:alanine racemase|nr:alanine racemase [Myxococcota bacterium]